MSEIRITVKGEAVPQGRPRFVRATGRSFDPPKSRAYKAKVKAKARLNAPSAPLERAVELSLMIYRVPPKSASKRRREAMLAGEIRPTTKPDVSNILKGVEDALNGIVYKDDSQIVQYGTVGKWYAEEPRVEITVKEI